MKHHIELTDEEQKAVLKLWESMGRPCSGDAYEWNDWIEKRDKMLEEIRLKNAQ